MKKTELISIRLRVKKVCRNKVLKVLAVQTQKYVKILCRKCTKDAQKIPQTKNQRSKKKAWKMIKSPISQTQMTVRIIRIKRPKRESASWSNRRAYMNHKQNSMIVKDSMEEEQTIILI